MSAVVAAIVSGIVILGFTSVFGYDSTEAVPIIGDSTLALNEFSAPDFSTGRLQRW